MCIFNITINNTQGYYKPVQDLYKDSLDNVLDSNIENIVANTINTKPEPLRQGAPITKLCMPQHVDILQLSEDFSQASNKRNKHSSSSTSVKLSPGLPSSIVPSDYSIINTSNISDDQVKWEQLKARVVEAYKRDIRQVTPLGKQKRRSLALKRSIQNNLDLVLVNNILIDLDSC